MDRAGRFHLTGDVVDNLKKLKLINKEGQVTNAAWLLFGKGNIGYNVHMGRLKTPSYIIDDRMFNGSLFETVEEAMRHIVSQIKVAFEIKGMPTQRTEIFEYPLPALREILLNQLIHRDYMSPVDIQIKIFDNKVTFYNPGNLYGGLTLSELKGDDYQVQARNKLIAEAFYLTGDIEKYGSGFVRIRNEIASYPTMEFNFEEKPTGFLVTLSYTEQKTSTAVKEGIKEGVNLSTNQRTIVETMSTNPRITIPELSAIVGINETNIQKNIKTLRGLGKIKRIGPAKGGYWEVTD